MTDLDRVGPVDHIARIPLPWRVEPEVRTSEGFTCPRCSRTSHNPQDRQEGYCGACHDWTGRPA